MTSIPAHYLHVYNRPAQGSAFVQRHMTYNYNHSIVNRGWFDTMSCDIAARSTGDGQRILEQYLGCRVAVFVDNPAAPIWEGLINRITFNTGGASYTISMDEMVNRASVVYTGAANVAAETTVVNNTSSQAAYGIKAEQIELGADPSAATQKTLLRSVVLAQQAYPQASLSQAQGDTNIIHIECIGIYHTLEWAKFFTATTAATTAFSTNVAAVVGADPNGTTFYDNTNTSQISTNAGTVASQERGASYWERLLKIAEAGDGVDYWVCGITPTNLNTGTRAFYYQIANTSIEYYASKASGLKPRTIYGRSINPWLIVPDRGIKITDALIGFDGSIILDPSSVYIQSIQYDANAQSVQWFGADDTTARAAFRLNRGFKPLSAPFGAPLRTIVT